MLSKRLLATLIVALTLVAKGCGNSTSNSSQSSDTPKEVQKIVENDSSRFSAKEVQISGTAHVNYSCIITDNITGKQYLYTQYFDGWGSGSTMVEIGTINDTTNNVH